MITYVCFEAVTRYSRDDLLSMRKETKCPPLLAKITQIACEESLPPVATLPFDADDVSEFV
jgi:hypothetical protein